MIQRLSERENIACRGVSYFQILVASFLYLWIYEVTSASHRGRCELVAYNLADAKVSDFKVLLPVNEDVGGLDISVHNVSLVKFL